MLARLVSLIALLSGCSSDIADTPGGSCWDGSGGTPEGSVEIGTGATAFEPVTAGQTLLVEKGFQGNHHVVVNIRITDLDPGDPSLPFEKRPRTRIVVLGESGAEIDAIPCPYQLAYEDKGAGFELPAGRLVVLRDDAIATIDGSTLTITADIMDNAGRKASSSVDVTAELLDAAADPASRR